MKKDVGIICTLGPATRSIGDIFKLQQAGMKIARLNFSHGSHSDHQIYIDNLKKAEKKSGKKIYLLQDLQGPKIRLGNLNGKSIRLKRGQKVVFTTSIKHSENQIPLSYPNIFTDLKVNQRILIKDGSIALKTINTNIKDKTITAKVLIGGEISSRNGVNLPDSEMTTKTITLKDKTDLNFGIKNKVDYIALSFVKTAKDINQIRNILNKKKSKAKIIAKIERHDALPHLEEIIKISDLIMVARGDLGADLPPEKIPLIQKKIIKLSNQLKKPVILATQILQSMIENPTASRAEISDAANGILDGADYLMLSNETATGKYPFEAARTLKRVIKALKSKNP